MDRGRAEREPVRDLLHAEALGEQFEDLALAGSQLEELLHLTRALAELGADERAAAGHDLDGAGDVLAGSRLEHIAGSPGPQREREQVRLGVGSEDDHPRLGAGFEDVLGRVDAVLARQLDIDDADVGLELLDLVDHLFGGLDLADDLDALDVGHARLDRLADDLVVVTEDYSFGSRGRHLRGNPLWSPEFLQNGGKKHASVLPLPVLQQRDEGPSHSHCSSVQGVHGFRGFSLRGTVPAGQASCLVVGGVGAACQLAIAVLAGYPALAIELAGRRRSEVADRDVDDPIRDLEGGEDALLDREDPLVLRPGSVRLDEAEHLDLVELVHAEDAAGVAAGRPGLSPEAGRDAAIALRQVAHLQDLVGVQGGERDLGGADQEELVPRHLVDHLALTRENAGPEEGTLADQNRRNRRFEALFTDQLGGEADQDELDHHQVAEQIGEARARRLGRRLHVDPAVALAEIEVVERLEAELRALPDLAQGDVVLLGFAIGRLGLRHVRQRDEKVLASRAELLELGLELLELRLQRARALAELRELGVVDLAGLRRLLDLRRQPVLVRPERVGPGVELA